MILPYFGESRSTSTTARKSLSFASASTQKTYRNFSGRSSRLTNGDRQVSASAEPRQNQPQASTTRPPMNAPRRCGRDMVFLRIRARFLKLTGWVAGWRPGRVRRQGAEPADGGENLFDFQRLAQIVIDAQLQ